VIPLDRILAISSETEFEEAALRLFRWQAEVCEPYRRYLALLDVDYKDVKRLEEIPFLPVELFKSEKIYCGAGEPEKVFTSSTTTGGVPSKHYVAALEDYQRTCRSAFERFWGAVGNWHFYCLLPSYLEREGSSLVAMAEDFVATGGGGFYLQNHAKMVADMAADPKPKILLGVTYALLDLAEELAPKLHDTVVMVTGGMKGRRPEMPQKELHGKLCEAFGVVQIASEYGMCEMMSQGYSRGSGIFEAPPWVRLLVRDLHDPTDMAAQGRGGVNIIDLANLTSCAFLQTQDLGRLHPDGSFEILGRIEGSELRGCNLLVDIG